MGFGAWGNASLTVWRGKRTLHSDAGKSDFGQRLDTAMRRLYEWCSRERCTDHGPRQPVERSVQTSSRRSRVRCPGTARWRSSRPEGQLRPLGRHRHRRPRRRALTRVHRSDDGTTRNPGGDGCSPILGTCGRTEFSAAQSVIDVLDRVIEAPETQVLLTGRLMYRLGLGDGAAPKERRELLDGVRRCVP